MLIDQMNFFKGYGYVTVSHALDFAQDLKLGHYLKIPPRQVFCCQVVACKSLPTHLPTYPLVNMNVKPSSPASSPQAS